MNRLFRSFSFAFKGITYAFKTQVNFRIHVVAALTVIIAGVYFELSTLEWCLLAICMGAVIILELVNTAIEVLVDLVSPGYNEKAGIVKDIAAAAVLVTAMISVIVAGFVFLPKMG